MSRKIIAVNSKILELGSRISHLRNFLKLSQTAFAAELGIKRGAATISSWETGIHEPKISVIQNICDRFTVNRNWLLTGEGEMLTGSQNVLSPPANTSSNYPIPADNVINFNNVNECRIVLSEEEAKKYATMAYRILTSETGYAGALKENIIWFRNAVAGDHRIEELETRLKIIEERLPKTGE